MIIIVLPIYNEEKAISDLIRGISQVMIDNSISYRIVAVDDGSQDRSREELLSLKDIPIVMVEHLKNKGLGVAIRSGFQHALGIGDKNDIVITMDADLTHPPSLIPRMVKEIDKGYDVVIASRFRKGGGEIGVPLKRRVFSKAASLLLRTLFPICGTRDYTCGYKAYRNGILIKAFSIYGDNFIQSKGFSCMVEILLKLRKLRVRVTEVPLILRYDLKCGKSKLQLLPTLKEYLDVVLKKSIFY